MAYTSKNPKVDSEIFTDIGATTPANPAASSYKLLNRGGTFFARDSSGVEVAVSSGGVSSPTDIKNYGFTTSVAANALTINLKTNSGADPSGGDPVNVAFRNAIAATGTFSIVSAVAATSIVISSGATLGQSSGVATYFYVYALNNAGTIELAISTTKFDDDSIQSSTTMSGSSTSATTLYSTTGRSNVAIRLIGRMLVNETAAGTWTSTPTEISLSDKFLTGGTYGKTDGLDVSAGQIGEQIRGVSVGGGVTCTGGSPTTIAQITLTPGVWDINLQAELAAASGLTDFIALIGTVNNSITGLVSGDNYWQGPANSVVSPGSCSVVQYRQNITTSTTYYLVIDAAATTTGFGRISAVRAG